MSIVLRSTVLYVHAQHMCEKSFPVDHNILDKSQTLGSNRAVFLIIANHKNGISGHILLLQHKRTSYSELETKRVYTYVPISI